ncbi:MAG: ATP-binding protein [Miltoncostaeaceae bacterium]
MAGTSQTAEVNDLALAVASAIAADSPTEDVLALVVRLAAQAVDGDVGTLGRALGDAIEVVATWTSEDERRSAPPIGSRLALSGTSPPAEVMRTGAAVLWNDGSRLDRAAREEVGDLVDSGSGIAVPLRVDGEAWGHLGVISATGGRLDQDATDATQALADVVAPLIASLDVRDEAIAADRFFQLSGDLFAILSRRGTIVRANPALGRALEAAAHEVVGSAWADWIDEADRAAAALWLGQMPHGIDNRRFDGRVAGGGRIVRWSAHLNPAGNDIYLIGRDVTHQLRTSRELDDLRQLQGAILASVGDGVYGVGLDGCATFVNPAAARMLGYEPEELLGQDTHEMLHHSRPDGSHYPREECPLMHAARDGTTARVDDEVFWRKDGTPVPVEYTATPLLLEGRPAGAVVSFLDISGRRAAEATRHEAAVREGLEQQNEELERLAARLEESNRDLEQFAYVASHDLQAPLRAIVSHLELIDDEIIEALDAETREDMRFVSEGAARMQNMIDSLLEYSRASRRESAYEPVDLGLVTDDAVRLLSADIEAAGAAVTRDEDLPIALGDEQQLVRVVQNLVGNALRYGPENEVRISITGEDAGDSCRLSVSDNGSGVPEKYRSRVFEMFKRLHTSDHGGGIGMGLAICARVIDRHGGSIWVDDAPGGGASFTFELQKQVD